MGNEEFINGKIEALEPLPLDPDFVRIAETILTQNSEILKMNGRLLSVLSMPMHFVGYTSSEEH